MNTISRKISGLLARIKHMLHHKDRWSRIHKSPHNFHIAMSRFVFGRGKIHGALVDIIHMWSVKKPLRLYGG